MPNFSKKTLLLVFFFAFAIRLFYLWEIHGNPTFDHPTLDARYHDEWAQAVAHGEWTQPQAFFRAPLYPYFLGLIYYVFGHNYYAPRIVQYLIGSFGVILLTLLGVRLFGKKAGIAAGLVFATYASVIYFEGELLLDSLLIPLDLLLFIFLYKAKENPAPGNWLLAGFWLGLSAITRPNILIFAPAVLFWIWYLFRQRETLLRQTKFAAFFVLGAILPILPVAYHNYRVERPLVLIASQGGINFYIGNNPHSNGYAAWMPGRLAATWELADIREAARQETGKNLSSGELSDFWFKKGVEFWREEPLKAFKLLVKKASLFITRLEISNNEDIYLAWQNSALMRFLPVGFWLVGPLGLLGILFSFVNRRARLISVFVLVYSVSVVIFFVNSRFRLPVLPFLTLFAGYAVFELWRRWRAKEQFFPYLGAMALFALLVNSNFYSLQKTSGGAWYFQQGNVFLEQGKLAEAENYFRLALQADPSFRFGHLNLGVVALKKGDLKTAEEEFKAELKTDPQSEKALSNLSLIKRLTGLPRLAAYWAEKAAAAKPYFPDAYLNWALAYRALQKPDSALAVLEEGRKRCQPFLLGDYLAASLNLEAKNYRLAETQLRGLIDSLDRRPPAYDREPFFISSREFGENVAELKSRCFYLLGRLRGEQNDMEGAIAHFHRALEFNPKNFDALADLGTALDVSGRSEEALAYFEKARALRPENYALHYNLGLALAKLSRWAEAEAAFKEALRQKPDFAPAREKLALIETLLEQNRPGPK